ncbi:hypothetical protein K7H91_21915 [Martelella mediterranea]|uniref:hypothetical protein n=1 Tax=Martelella mediterranea TaxID=293089 RepID=UPI001E4B64F0|nr:hypothetical protein [Martelella mediterranea]MCD1636420.1 hypothetical protein [Martelella mediterranea]
MAGKVSKYGLMPPLLDVGKRSASRGEYLEYDAKRMINSHSMPSATEARFIRGPGSIRHRHGAVTDQLQTLLAFGYAGTVDRGRGSPEAQALRASSAANQRD